MNQGYCKLCIEYKELCNSHAIPDSAFKYITRQSSGKAIAINSDKNTLIEYSSDSWDVELLCADCESFLNESFDKYGISVFRGEVGTVKKTEQGISFSGINRKRLRMFFLSVLWRISVSHHVNYSNVRLPKESVNELFLALREIGTISRKKYMVFVTRMKDSTKTKGFSMEEIRNFQFTPFCRNYAVAQSVCIVFFGFFIEIYINGIPKKYHYKTGLLNGTSHIFLAPYIEILEIPEILQTLAIGLNKQNSGKTRVT